MSGVQAKLESLLGGSTLASLRRRLRSRFERGAASDTFILDRLNPDERLALEKLLGRRGRSASSMSLSLTEMDGALARAGVAESLQRALEQLDGPIREIARERIAARAGWEIALARVSDPRLAALLAEPQGRGLLKSVACGDPAAGAALVDDAHRVLALLPADGTPLARLAAQALGDAHALDEGRSVATLVIACLRAVGETRQRETWSRMGVLAGELACPVLTFNLRADSAAALGRMLLEATQMGQPLHLSMRMLAGAGPEWRLSGSRVFVCENPTVIAMAADRLGRDCAPMVCTDGMPSGAQRSLLSQLSACGAHMLYHGDFDWPGLRIANYVIRTFGAAPWRFGAEHYRPEGGFPLTGDPVEALWDTALTPAMSASDQGLHEEAVIEELLEDLAETGAMNIS